MPGNGQVPFRSGWMPKQGTSSLSRGIASFYQSVDFNDHNADGATLWNDWFFGSAGTVSGTLATTEGADTAAFTGAVGTSGTLTTTEGADAAAFAGAAGTSGVLAATEAADIAVFTGGGVISGTLAAVEGQDVAAFTGTISISGTLAAVEGQDVATFSGSFSGIVSGTLTVVEGQDVAAFAVTVPAPAVSGVISAVETGDAFQGEVWLGAYKIFFVNSYIGISEVFGNNIRRLWTKVYSGTTSFTDHAADIGRIQLQRTWTDSADNEYQMMFDALGDANREVDIINLLERKDASDALVYRTHTLQLVFDGEGRKDYDMYVSYSPNVRRTPPLDPRNLNGA